MGGRDRFVALRNLASLAHAPGLARSCTQTLQRLASLAQPPGLARSCTHPASAALIRVLPPSPSWRRPQPRPVL